MTRKKNSYESDEAVAYELILQIDNTRRLHEEYMQFAKNYVTKMARGEYDSKRAEDGFMHLAEAGAKSFAKEHGLPGASWHKMFPVPVRRVAAQHFVKRFEAEAALGNYDHLLPKKYQGKRSANPARTGRSLKARLLR